MNNRAMNWIRRVPVWVWLFLAVTQVATIVGASIRLSDSEVRLDDPEIQAVFDRFAREDRTKIIGASVAGSTFVVLGLWRWRFGSRGVDGREQEGRPPDDPHS